MQLHALLPQLYHNPMHPLLFPLQRESMPFALHMMHFSVCMQLNALYHVLSVLDDFSLHHSDLLEVKVPVGGAKVLATGNAR